MQIKTIIIPVRMVITKNLQTINAGEDVEEREPSNTVGWNVNMATMENNMEVPQITKNRASL